MDWRSRKSIRERYHHKYHHLVRPPGIGVGDIVRLSSSTAIGRLNAPCIIPGENHANRRHPEEFAINFKISHRWVVVQFEIFFMVYFRDRRKAL